MRDTVDAKSGERKRAQRILNHNMLMDSGIASSERVE